MIRSLIHFSLFTVMTIFFALPAFAEFEFREIELTDAKVKNYIKADPDLQIILKEIDEAGDTPNTKLITALEGIAKKHGFKSFEELDNVAQTVAFIITGFDAETGNFIEPHKAIQDELQEIKQDKTIPEKERNELIKELEEAIKNVPNVRFKSNIALIKLHLSELLKLN